MKKVCVTILLLCLTFGIQTWAKEVTEEPSPSQEMPAEVQVPPQGQTPQQGQMPPQGERPQGQMPPQGERPQGQWGRGQMPQQGHMPQGEMPQGEMPQGQMPREQGGEQSAETETPVTENNEENAVAQPGGAEMGGMPRMMGNTETTSEPMGVLGFFKTYATSVVSVVLLIGAFLFVKLYKRKMY